MKTEIEHLSERINATNYQSLNVFVTQKLDLIKDNQIAIMQALIKIMEDREQEKNKLQ